MSWNTELSPFASVIGTNHVASAEELKSLQALLVHPQQELSRLETEIEQIQSVLDDLLSRKRIVLNYLNAHKALASPVRQIPPETLGEIFMHCLPTEYSYATRDLNKAPLLLTTICRDWRRVALTTPRLWNSLHIFLPFSLSEDACSRRCAGTAMWLQRSGSLPLSISLHSNIIVPDNEKDLVKQVGLLIGSLMSFSDRFRDIYLSLSSPNLMIFDNLSPAFFSSLVSLRLRNPLPGYSPSSTPSPHLSRMPLLTRLEFEDFFVGDQNYHTLPCNWKNITNLVIKDALTPAQVIAILAETPQMQVLSLLVSFGINDASAVVHLNNLSEMRLTVFANELGEETFDIFQTGMASFIHCIECPTLRLLHFSYSQNYVMITISKWPFPLHTLETLHLSMPLTPDALMDCIALTPNLTTFRSSTAMWPRTKFPLEDRHLLKLALSPDNPNPLWPRLQDISFQLVEVDQPEPSLIIPSISNAAFIAFLESRCQEIPLKCCDVVYDVAPSFSEAELNALHNLKQNGLKLRLRLLAYPSYIPPACRDSPDLGLWSSSDTADCHLDGVDIF